jgi:hypothetical protein
LLHQRVRNNGKIGEILIFEYFTSKPLFLNTLPLSL